MSRRGVTASQFHDFVRRLGTPGTWIEVTHADGRREYLTVTEYQMAKARGLAATTVDVIEPGHQRRIRA